MRMIEFREALDSDLGATTEYSDEELERAVRRAVSDLSRYVPRQRSLDVTISIDVTDETFTTVAGQWVTLDYKPITPGSDTVKLAASPNTEYTIDTDYEMDYIGGRIRHLTGGAMTIAAHKITYKRSAVEVDLTGTGAADAFSIHTVEYPYGLVPFESRSFRIYDNILTVVADEGTQERLSAGKHLLVRYLTFHDPPSVTKSGTFPRVLDEVVAKGATAYALWALANRQERLAVSDLASVRTSIAKTADIHTNIGHVRDQMYLVENSSNAKFQAALSGFLAGVSSITSTLDAITATATVDESAGAVVLAAARIAAAHTEIDSITPPLTRATNELLEIIPNIVEGAAGPYDELAATLVLAEVELSGADEKTGAGDLLNGLPESVDGMVTDGGELFNLSTHITDSLDNIGEVAFNLVSGRSEVGGEDDEQALGDLADGGALLTKAETALTKSRAFIDTNMTAKITLADGTGDTTTSDPSMVAKVTTHVETALGYLGTGDKLINKVNVGENVPGHYKDYAQTTLAGAQAMAGQRDAYIAEGNQFLAAAQVQVNEATQQVAAAGRRVESAQARVAIANGFLGEAQVKVQQVRERLNHGAQKLEQIRTKIQVAQQLIQVSGAYTTVAARRLETMAAHVASSTGWLQIAQHNLQAADRYIAIGALRSQEAATRLGLSRAYLEEADVAVRYHSDHTREIGELVGQIRAYTDESTAYRLAAQASSELAVSIRAEANNRYLEFRSLMISAAKLYAQGTIASPLQNP